MGRFRDQPKGVGSQGRDSKRKGLDNTFEQVMIWSDLIGNDQWYLPGYRNTNDGRGALDIARQVKAETGAKTPLEQLKDDIQKMMDAWKQTTYPQAWAYMQQCAKAVTDPGYLKNPWGRVRHFAKTTRTDVLASMSREAQNFPKNMDGEVKQGEFMESPSLLTTMA